MAEIPPLVSATTAAAQGTTHLQPESDSTYIQAQILEVPDRYAALVRQAQVNGTVAQILSNSFSLQTAAGQVQLALPPDGSAAANALLQFVTQSQQLQKQISLLLQPGSPPQQALVFVPHKILANPEASTVAGLQNERGNEAIHSFAQLKIGQTLSLLPLPNNWESGSHLVVAGGLGGPIQSAAAGAVQSYGNYSAQQTAQRLEAGLFSGLLPPGQIAEDLVTGQGGGNEAGSIGSDSGNALNIQKSAQNLHLSENAGNAAYSVNKTANTLSYKIVAIQLPGAGGGGLGGSGASDNASFQGNMDIDALFAEVIGKGANGNLIIGQNGKTFFVRTEGDLPLGTQLKLLPLAEAQEQGPQPLKEEDSLLGRFEEILSALQLIDPQSAQNFLRSHLPQPNQSMPASLLFFMTLFQNFGGSAGMFNENIVKSLEKAGKVNLLSLLKDEMQKEQFATDAIMGNWRALSVPVYTQGALHHLSLYIHADQDKHHGNDAQNETETTKLNQAASTRFVIDLTLSKLGAMQIDGLSRPKQLDLIIRSEKTLPESLQGELRANYAAVMEAIGHTGTLLLKHNRQGWVQFTPQHLPNHLTA